MVTFEPKLRELFSKALDCPSSEARAAYLDQACQGDAELRARVDELLGAHAEAGSFLNEPAPPVRASMDTPAPAAHAGTRIGPYTLIEPIGEGGMGAVWMAQQSEPVRRLVALKLIKAGMDSRQVLARFEAERQALALMDHPNIARVLDAGTTDAGRPYLVMDLVKGVPITRYCDEHHLTPRQRLDLFIPVCQAVQHAHQKGVVHRDLKPSNVLVELYDGRPVPKVIDFGVAKAAGPQLTDQSLVTGFGTIVGTLEYMSPEQAEVNQLDVDTRSDIYSLGVLLYELLTGSTPFTKKDLKKAGMLEMLRVIREEEPSKPSSKLSTAEALPTVAANRGTEPAKLTKLVRGDLDWIVMKTLEKDRNRRYESSNGLAADVLRYLADEPVIACPPTAWYRFRKFARRNRRGVVTVGIVAAALLLGTAVSVWQAVRATQAEEYAIRQRDTAIAAERTARESEADTAAFGEFLEDVLAVARPKGQNGGLGIGVTVRQALDEAAPKIGETFRGRPRAEAKARATLGSTYLFAGDAKAAIAQLEVAVKLFREQFGPDHFDALDAGYNLALAYQVAEQRDKAIPLFEDTLKLQKVKFGAEHRATLLTMCALGVAYREAGRFEAAVPLQEETLKIQRVKLGPDHEDTLSTMNNLASTYHKAGRNDEALSKYEDALRLQKTKLGATHPNTLAMMANLAGAYLTAGRSNDALRVFEESLELMKTNLGPDHPFTLGTMSNLAVTYRNLGRRDESLHLFEETLKLQKSKLGPGHSFTINTMRSLAGVYLDAGRPAEALALFEDALKVQKAKLEPDLPSTLATMSDIAFVHLAAGRLNEAVPLFEETVKRQTAKLGREHPSTLDTMDKLAMAYHAAGKADLAQPLLEEAVKLARGKLGADHTKTLEITAELGLSLVKGKKYAAAEPILRECLATRERKEPDEWTTFQTRSLLGASLLGRKQYADAEPLLLAGYEGMLQRKEKIQMPNRFRLTEALERLVQLYEAWGKKEQAGIWRTRLEANKAENSRLGK